MVTKMKIGIYPGSFDPITFGHLDVIKRSAALVDKLVIGVLNNRIKQNLFSAEERVELIREVTKGISNLEIEAFHGLLVDFAERKQANVIVRGLRAITDFEYELQMAQTNHKLKEDIDTIFLTTNVEYSYLSSSVVREIGAFGGEIERFVPACIVERVKENCREM